MNSNFEKQLRSQRQNMDIEAPDDEIVWAGIVRKLGQSKPGRFQFSWKAAAIFIFLVSASYVFYNEFYRNKTPDIYNITLSEIEPAYAGRVTTIRADIDAKWKLVHQSNAADLESLKLFFTELNDLDAMYREYQEDYQSYGYSEELVRAMLDYYDKRIRILDRILMEIEKQKTYEKRNEVHIEI